MMRLGAILFVAGLMVGCATMNARSAFTRGERARQKGDLRGAILEYRRAADADPKREEYRTALAEAQREAASVHLDLARQREAARDFGSAIELYDRALEIMPDSDEIRARRGLAELRLREGDPVAFYRAARKLAEAIPSDPSAKAALVEAKRAALAYHLRLAQVYADARSWSSAHSEYAMAKEIEPNHPIFANGTYGRVRARHLEELGDKKLADGDSLGAYQAYEEASRLSQSGAIAKKMTRAKRGAGSMFEQIDQAQRYERQAKWEDAAELYTIVASNENASVDMQEKARVAREKSAGARSKRAEEYAARGMAEKACTELTLALEHTDAPRIVMDLLEAAVQDLTDENPGAAIVKLESARERAMHLALLPASEKVARAVARSVYDGARQRASNDPARALVALHKLQPFAAELPGYEATRQGLVKRAFGALIDRIEGAVNAGELDAAADQLATALEIAKPPKAIADHLAAGMKAMTEKRYATARRGFGDAVKADGRSKLAKLGLRIAADAHLAELHRDAAEARVAEDSVRAATLYRAILEINPEDESAKRGVEELRGELIGQALGSARDHEAAGRRGAAFIYYRRVLAVDPQHDEAKSAVAKLSPKLGAGDEPEAYVTPTIRGAHLGSECAGLEGRVRDRLALYLNRTPKVGAAFLTKDGTEDVDREARQMPPVKLRSAIETCVPLAKDGQMVLTVQLLLGSSVIVRERVTAKFDSGSIPKDELEDGIGPDQVLDGMIGDASRQVSALIKQHAKELESWRLVEAHARMQANDAEGVAQVYASLVDDRSLSDPERRTVEELERFLMNRFR